MWRGFQAHVMGPHLNRLVKIVSGGMSKRYAYGHGLQFLMDLVMRIAMPVAKARHDNFSTSSCQLAQPVKRYG